MTLAIASVPSGGVARGAFGARAAAILIVAACLAAACGKKGPPLAPLVRVPAVPQDVAARRVGGVADLQFRIPTANADSSRPADIQRVEVYGITTASPDTADVVKDGTLVASVLVKKPAEEEEEGAASRPDERPAPPKTASPDQPPPGGRAAAAENGFEQGDLVVVTEPIGPAQLTVVEPKRRRGRRTVVAEPDPWIPLLEPPDKGTLREYFVVGVNHKGQRGSLSPPQPVPLAPPPSAPAAPAITYDEKGLTLSWPAPPDLPRPVQAPPGEGMLEATPRGLRSTTGGYNVYEAGSEPPAAAPPKVAVAGSLAKPLNEAPLEAPTFTVPGLQVGQERCFVVRTVARLGTRVVESGPSPRACVSPADTFPPAAPKGLSAVGSEGAISLIWEANAEADLAGYIVLRAEAGQPPQPLTAAPIKETTFRDATVARGVRYVYTLVAVDTAGNRSAPSAGVEETAR